MSGYINTTDNALFPGDDMAAFCADTTDEEDGRKGACDDEGPSYEESRPYDEFGFEQDCLDPREWLFVHSVKMHNGIKEGGSQKKTSNRKRMRARYCTDIHPMAPKCLYRHFGCPLTHSAKKYRRMGHFQNYADRPHAVTSPEAIRWWTDLMSVYLDVPRTPLTYMRGKCERLKPVAVWMRSTEPTDDDGLYKFRLDTVFQPSAASLDFNQIGDSHLSILTQLGRNLERTKEFLTTLAGHSADSNGDKMCKIDCAVAKVIFARQSRATIVKAVTNARHPAALPPTPSAGIMRADFLRSLHIGDTSAFSAPSPTTRPNHSAVYHSAGYNRI